MERGQANPTLNAMEVIANGLGLTFYELWDRVRDSARRPQSREKQSLPRPASKESRVAEGTRKVTEAQALAQHAHVMKDVAVMRKRIRELTRKSKDGTSTRAEDRELNKLSDGMIEKLLKSAQQIGDAVPKSR